MTISCFRTFLSFNPTSSIFEFILNAFFFTCVRMYVGMSSIVYGKTIQKNCIATAQLRLAPGDGGRKKSKKFRFDINFSSMGTIFLVVCMYVGMSSIVYWKTIQKNVCMYVGMSSIV